MKKFIKQGLVFGLIVFSWLSVLQLIISIRINGQSVNGQDNLDQTSNINADIIFIGNSRCITSINPLIFKQQGYSVSNLGLHGNPNVSFVMSRLKNYIRNNDKAPQYVIFNLDPYSSTGKSNVMKDRFARYAFGNPSKYRELIDYFDFDFNEKYIPSYAILKYRKFFDCLLLNNQSTFLKLGFECNPGDVCSTKFSKNEVAEHVSLFRKSNKKSKLLNEIKDLQIFCTQNKIKLIGLQLPVFQVIRTSDFDLTNKIATKLNLQFFDLASIENSQNCALFKDKNHLNDKGANYFSLEIAKLIKTKLSIN
jgi:hypothetical protein